MKRPDEICARPEKVNVTPPPSTTPIYPAAVYECESLQQADALLAGDVEGFVYQRDGHPNAVVLSEQCRQLHGGDDLGVAFAQVTSTGMSAMALAMVSHLKSGDHVLLSDQLYGRTTRLVKEELSRWGLDWSEVNMCELDKVAESMRAETRMVVVESIANPLLHVVDLEALGNLAHQNDAVFVVDNTFATPIICRPFEWGADLVMESMSKIMNGHGDVMLGLLCGKEFLADRARNALSTWGISASPFDCWLASRGLATAPLRVQRAAENAAELSAWLSEHSKVSTVYYPKLASHPTHETAARILESSGFGHVFSVQFHGGRPAVEQFINLSEKIKFCPSLGEIATTVSHPRSTSHRGMPAEIAESMGIGEGLMRVSCGIETFEFLRDEFETILAAMD